MLEKLGPQGVFIGRSFILKKLLPIIECSGLSDIGPVRDDNQDSIHLPNGLHSPDSGFLFAVADGMGGYSHGAIASQLALQSFSDVLYGGTNKPNSKTFRRGIESANLAVYKTAEQLGAGRMGTTLTAAFVLEDILHLAHVGDSRAYLVRDGRAVCLTADHTMVGDMLRAKLISPEKVRTHAQRSILTRSVGIGLFIKPDIIQMKVQENDHFILCSDGAWSVIQDDEFAQIVNNNTGVEQISQDLIDLALVRETDDNASVVVFRIREFIPTDMETVGSKFKWLLNRRKLSR